MTDEPIIGGIPAVSERARSVADPRTGGRAELRTRGVGVGVGLLGDKTLAGAGRVAVTGDFGVVR